MREAASPMTAQQVFDTVYTTLKARGFTQARRGAWDCAYRSEVGPCAAGIFIPDEEYDRTFEGTAVPTSGLVASHYTPAQSRLVNILASVVGEDNLLLLREMQGAHDLSADSEHMEQRLRTVARAYRLTVPGDAEVTHA
jgi:hypothetical protein